MSDVIKLLELDWRNGLLFALAIFIVAVFLMQKWGWIIEHLGVTTSRKLQEQRHDEDIQELKSHAKKTDENIDKIIKSIENLQDSVHKVSDLVTAMQEKSNSAERSRLKDRIGQVYRHHMETKSWTVMEKDAFEDLVKSYEDAGGENSFVHTICLPASLTWKIEDET